MKKIIILFLLILFLPLFSSPVHAAVVFEDHFDNGLTNWSVQNDNQNNTITTELDTTDSAHGNLLKLYYSGSGYIKLEKQLSSPIQGRAEIEFYDRGPNASEEGFMFSALQGNKYIALGLNTASSQNYLYRIGTQHIDTGITRSAGYHKLILFVSPTGAWAQLDDHSLKNLGTSTTITSLEKISLEDLDWVNVQRNTYFDNVIVQSQSQSIEDLPMNAVPLLFHDENGQQTTSLNGTWLIKPEAQNISYQNITVPGFWRRTHSETELYTNSTKTDVFRNLDNAYRDWIGSVWYGLKFSVPPELQGKTIKLYFDAVAAKAEVYINGQLVGSHLGVYDPFEFEIQNSLLFGQDNILTIRVTDSSSFENVSIPSNYFERQQGGIWRGVKLIAKNPAFINNIVDIYPQNSQSVRVYLDLKNNTSGDNFTLASTITDPANNQVIKSSSYGPFNLAGNQSQQIMWPIDDIPGATPWSPENPKLYLFSVQLLKNGSVIDQMSKQFGFRTFVISGNKFSLNGQPYFLKGVSFVAHNRTPNDAEFARQFLQKVKEVGANAIRFAASPPSEIWVKEADKQGLLSLIDFPGGYADNNNFKQEMKKEYINLLNTMYTHDHPSVAIFALANEIILFDPASNAKRDFFNEVQNNLITTTDLYHIYLSDAGCQSFTTFYTVFAGNFPDICGNSQVTDTHWYYMWYRYNKSDPFNNQNNLEKTNEIDFNVALDKLFSFPSGKPHLFSEYGGAYTDEQGNFWTSNPPNDSQQSIDTIGTNPNRPTDALYYQSKVFEKTTQVLLSKKDNTRLAGIFLHGFDYALYNSFNLDWNNLKIWYKASFPYITDATWQNHQTLEPKPAFYALQKVYRGNTSALPGNLNNDDKVNISDYNLLLQNFGNTTCGNVADIDGNCKVDIFDYNILVGNFGK